jgi:dienelactone hydrolase
MRRMRTLSVLLVSLLYCVMDIAGAAAQDKVSIISFDSEKTPLNAYLFRGDKPGAQPAVVFLHGCGGLISTITRRISGRETDWARRLNDLGYSVLMVDSFTTRNSGEMCSRSGFKEWLYGRRPDDAYGGLAWLQQQPFVDRRRVGLMGWSNGGGATLMALSRGSHNGRPTGSNGPDFGAAIAFYPGTCDAQHLGADWTTSVPLMILQGEKDVWTPYVPCKAVADHAMALGAPVDMHAYPDAYHDFDWPHLKLQERVSYTTSKGVEPITGENPEARADAIQRVQAFLAAHL